MTKTNIDHIPLSYSNYHQHPDIRRRSKELAEIDKKRDQRLKRSLGAGALTAVAGVIAGIYRVGTALIPSPADSHPRSRDPFNFPPQSEGGLLTIWAKRHLRDAQDQARSRRQVVEEINWHSQAQASSDYLKRNPDVKRQLDQEAYDDNVATVRAATSGGQDYLYKTMLDTGRYGMNGYSFSKAIPRRPSHEGEQGFTGEYRELAETTLQSAMSDRQADGSILLMSPRRADDQAKQGLARGESVQSLIARQRADTGGVATTLWQLGYFAVVDEDDIPFGKMTVNPATNWQQTDQGMAARLSYDPNNELHQLLLGDQAPEGKLVEVVLGNGIALRLTDTEMVATH